MSDFELKNSAVSKAKAARLTKQRALMQRMAKVRDAKSKLKDMENGAFRTKVRALGYFLRDASAGHYHHARFHLDVFVNVRASRREKLAMLINLLDKAKEESNG